MGLPLLQTSIEKLQTNDQDDLTNRSIMHKVKMRVERQKENLVEVLNIILRGYCQRMEPLFFSI